MMYAGRWQDLWDVLETIDWAKQPSTVMPPYGELRCRYDEDMHGEYVQLGLRIPSNDWYVDLGGDAWGYLGGLRHYVRWAAES